MLNWLNCLFETNRDSVSVIRCKAAVAWEPGKPLTIEDVEVAPPKVHEVRIKIIASGSQNSHKGTKLFLFFCHSVGNVNDDRCRKNWANTQAGVMADGSSRISYKGQQVYQFLGVSSFSQYTVVPDTSLAKIEVMHRLTKCVY
ncbi:hypothetical protein CgunFtcFv8_017338 [Champsocephalus gunnari]|uniref:Uncharacterized protein n=1 Tax=Champsocephalus gunnari TaxID=52237 RepID=A0AAN8DM31_CHAGU|nr:hypothetical protein CgunFtcFv8_017338 [Champsocephalus gunnari]